MKYFKIKRLIKNVIVLQMYSYLIIGKCRFCFMKVKIAGRQQQQQSLALKTNKQVERMQVRYRYYNGYSYNTVKISDILEDLCSRMAFSPKVKKQITCCELSLPQICWTMI